MGSLQMQNTLSTKVLAELRPASLEDVRQSNFDAFKTARRNSSWIMRNRTFAIISAFWVLLLVGAVCGEDPEPQFDLSPSKDDLVRDFERDLALIKSLRDTNDLDQVELAARQIVERWKDRSKPLLAKLLSEICITIYSISVTDLERKYGLVYDNASLGVTMVGSENIEPRLKKRLILQVGSDLGQISDDARPEWPKRRQSTSKLFLDFLSEINYKIDPNIDWDDLPLANVGVPGSSGTAGVAPDSINDPAIRAEYEKAIEANKRKAEYRTLQGELLDLKKTFPQEVKRYLVSAYSRPPFRESELKGLLYTSDLSAELKKEILDEVALLIATQRVSNQ